MCASFGKIVVCIGEIGKALCRNLASNREKYITKQFCALIGADEIGWQPLVSQSFGYHLSNAKYYFLSITTPYFNTPQEYLANPGCARMVQLFHTALGIEWLRHSRSAYPFCHPKHPRSLQDIAYTTIAKVANKKKLCRRIYSEEQNTFATMSDHAPTREVANKEKLCGSIDSEEQNTFATMSNDAPQNVSKNQILATFADMRLRVKDAYEN